MARRTASGRIVYATELREAMTKYLPHRGLPLQSADGRVRWTPRLLVMTAVQMAWVSATALADAFATAREATVAMYDSRRRPGETLAGFLEALAKASDALLEVVVAALRRAVPKVAGADWTFRGWVVMGVDGTRIDCPRTTANEKALGCAGKTGTAPQMLLTTLFHVTTGLPWAWRRGRGDGSERADLTAMLGVLPALTLLLADAGYVGYAMLQALGTAGHAFIVRVGCNVHLLEGLGYAVRETKGQVYLWPQGHRDQPPLVLRLVRVWSGKYLVSMLTNLTTAQLSNRAVANLYRQRWGIELLYRSLKRTMRGHKMLSERPDHAALELDWTIVGLGLLGLMAAEATSRGGRGGRHWSLALAQQAVRQAMRRLRVPRPAGGLRGRLRRCVKDSYIRHRPKAARYWPRKKAGSPPGEPKIRMATREEIRQAQAFHHATTPN